MSKITTTERGWAGHFIGGHRCRYHRNTLVSTGNDHIVVSSIGLFQNMDLKVESIGYSGEEGMRYYECMCFIGHHDGPYIEADVSYQVTTGDDVPWFIAAKNADQLPPDACKQADDIHDANVKWVKDNFADAMLKAREPGGEG